MHLLTSQLIAYSCRSHDFILTDLDIIVELLQVQKCCLETVRGQCAGMQSARPRITLCVTRLRNMCTRWQQCQSWRDTDQSWNYRKYYNPISNHHSKEIHTTAQNCNCCCIIGFVSQASWIKLSTSIPGIFQDFLKFLSKLWQQLVWYWYWYCGMLSEVAGSPENFGLPLLTHYSFLLPYLNHKNEQLDAVMAGMHAKRHLFSQERWCVECQQ